MNGRNLLVGAIAIAVIAGAGWLLWSRMNESETAGEPPEMKAIRNWIKAAGKGDVAAVEALSTGAPGLAERAVAMRKTTGSPERLKLKTISAALKSEDGSSRKILSVDETIDGSPKPLQFIAAIARDKDGALKVCGMRYLASMMSTDWGGTVFWKERRPLDDGDALKAAEEWLARRDAKDIAYCAKAKSAMDAFQKLDGAIPPDFYDKCRPARGKYAKWIKAETDMAMTKRKLVMITEPTALSELLDRAMAGAVFYEEKAKGGAASFAWLVMVKDRQPAESPWTVISYSRLTPKPEWRPANEGEIMDMARKIGDWKEFFIGQKEMPKGKAKK